VYAAILGVRKKYYHKWQVYAKSWEFTRCTHCIKIGVYFHIESIGLMQCKTLLFAGKKEQTPYPPFLKDQ